MRIRIADEVSAAVTDGRPVVALESTLLAHGLPAGRNREVADRLERVVRERGAVPATVAVLDGEPVVGLSGAELDRVCDPDAGLVKLSRRDLAPASALGSSGATTVAATVALAHAGGIAVFATGGLGGVHRGARDSWDVSADLGVLADTPMLVVCSGVKSILDIGARLEGLKGQEQTIRASLAARRNVLAEVLGALQRMGLNPPPAILVKPEDALSSVRSAILLGAVVPELRQQTDILVADLKEHMRVTASIEAERQRLATAVTDQVAEKQRLNLLMQAKDKLQSDTETAISDEQKKSQDQALQDAGG